MGILDKIFNKKENASAPQTFKHNIYEPEISQYSSLPRYYYIEGKKYDIDSPESVLSIPLCKCTFNINGESWGIDAVLREHVNRYYSHIPDAIKSACYSKISEYRYSPYITETSAEKAARLKQEAEKAECIAKARSITKADMQKNFSSKYEMTDVISDNGKAIMLINKNNQQLVLHDLNEFNNKIPLAMELADIKTNFLIPLSEIEFESIQKKTGEESYTQYYTFFECTPYTKTGKSAKYPLILHYATKNYDSLDFDAKFFGDIYYMQDGTIGKARLINWIKHKCYVIEYGMVGTSLSTKSVTTTDNSGNKIILYKK